MCAFISAYISHVNSLESHIITIELTAKPSYSFSTNIKHFLLSVSFLSIVSVHSDLLICGNDSIPLCIQV